MSDTGKRLGRILKVSFGHGGYNDAMLGIHVTLGNDSWGVGTEKSAWDANIIECTERSKWTESDRDGHYSEIMRYVSDLLRDAKVSSVDKLAGVPVEVTFEGNLIKDWRILTEVI